jgi:hypothetical protein
MVKVSKNEKWLQNIKNNKIYLTSKVSLLVKVTFYIFFNQGNGIYSYRYKDFNLN